MKKEKPVRKKPELNLVNKVKQPFSDFLAMDISAGVLLVIATLTALIWANSPYSESYFGILNTPISLKIGSLVLSNSLSYWIKDVLMTIFFFLVGLEIKEELSIGHLSKRSQASLPVFAALGGMIVPALIYFFLNKDAEFVHGWGIPMATDIAFAVGVLTLLGTRIPLGLRIFLLALAIIDDLGAVLVIAFFYSDGVSATYLLYSAMTVFLVYLMNQSGIRNISLYVIVGIFLWFFFHESGIHSTVAGVILGLMTPYYRIEEEDNAPLDRLVSALHPWVNYFVMPVFALANAGVVLAGFSFGEFFSSTVSLGIALGLLIGKPVGVFVFSYLACKLKIANLPQGVHWNHIAGAGILAGIGFTMSLFINSLAFGGSHAEDVAKLGIFVGSLLSAVLGYFFLYFKTKTR